ncbi:MAG: choice-of-anchor Q domain-containing protein, partial [Bacteroidota bacterium]
MLADLAYNGGPTLTHALEAGSPAIDMGQTVETVDQRGFARADGTDDMGAFELGATPPMMVASGETAEVQTEEALTTMEEAVRLRPVAPNPLATGRTGSVTFAVRDAEAVEVSLYDATGRRVATLYSGTPIAGQEQTVALDASSLASGVYVVRLLGETVQATQRVTLVR